MTTNIDLRDAGYLLPPLPDELVLMLILPCLTPRRRWGLIRVAHVWFTRRERILRTFRVMAITPTTAKAFDGRILCAPFPARWNMYKPVFPHLTTLSLGSGFPEHMTLMFPQMPNLRRLMLGNLDYSEPAAILSESWFATVEELEVWGTLDTGKRISRPLSAFSKLHTIRLLGHTPSHPFIHDWHRVMLPTVHTVECIGTDVLLALAPYLPSLCNVRVRRETMERVALALEDIKPLITSLYVSHKYPGNNQPPRELQKNHQTNHITSLSFEVHEYVSHFYYDRMFEAFPNLTSLRIYIKRPMDVYVYDAYPLHESRKRGCHIPYLTLLAHLRHLELDVTAPRVANLDLCMFDKVNTLESLVLNTPTVSNTRFLSAMKKIREIHLGNLMRTATRNYITSRVKENKSGESIVIWIPSTCLLPRSNKNTKPAPRKITDFFTPRKTK